MSYVHKKFENEPRGFFDRWFKGQKVVILDPVDFFVTVEEVKSAEIVSIDWREPFPIEIYVVYNTKLQKDKVWKGPVEPAEICTLEEHLRAKKATKEYCAALDDPNEWRKHMQKKQNEMMSKKIG